MAVAQSTMSKPGISKKTSPSFGLDKLRPEIEKRAKEIFVNRQSSKIPGNEISDWLQAEKEIKAKHNID